MNQDKLLETLAGIRFLHGVSREHLEQIAAAAQVCDLSESDVVFREGEIAQSIYFVVSGKLELELSPSTLECKHLVTVGPGEMLGWSSLTELPRFAATAVVVDPTQLIRVDGARLQAICDEDPQFGYEFMRRAVLALAKRLMTTWTQLSQMQVSQYLPVTAPSGKSNL